MKRHNFFEKWTKSVLAVIVVVWGFSQGYAFAATPPQGGTPNYFGPEPNWAWSPQPTVVGGVITGGGIHKFVDALPQLGVANLLGQKLVVAVKDTTTYPGSDYYEIALVEYTQKMHTDLQPTTLRGYVQVDTAAIPDTANKLALTYPNGTAILDAGGHQVYGVDKPSYLGPAIVATKNTPVRVKFTNYLPKGSGGNLFLPVDKTEMGAGMGPLGMMVSPGNQMDYTQNRGTLHLHGGLTPWISDGTPHQWITPAGDNTDYPKGVSAQNVPDMPDPGPGSQTFFYSNQQSARLMFYHDHAYGITRLNVYAGEAAGYVLTDPTEQDLITRGILPDIGIPLVIQDKTFVDPTTVLVTDPTWPFALDATKSNLFYPHVYMTNQNPNDLAGANALGRWDYGPWFWPPWPVANAPITLPDGTVVPNVPDLSMTMEAFHDTPVVNGTVYPYIDVQPKAYRFRILNAANDRMFNLQLYQASSIVGGITITGAGSGYTAAPLVTITPAPGDTTGHGATAQATIDPATHGVIGIDLQSVGSAYTLAPVVTIAPPTGAGTTATATATLYSGATEVGMVPAVQGVANFPAEWTAQTIGQPGDILDGRTGGVPDPAKIGPSMIQIGTEGGFLPAPVVWPNIPIGFNRNPKDITVLNVLEHNLFLGPAERADVIIDFSQFRGKTLILYNDAGAAVPAADSRLDYYTSDLDQTDTGGTRSTLPGYGPNTRTLMQIRVADVAPATAYNLTALNTEFASTGTTQGVFARSQDPIIVPQAPYNSAYNGSFPADTTAYARIQSNSLTFRPLNLTTPTVGDQVATPVTINFKAKAIQELFENAYGRMNATLGVELPFTNGQNQTTIPYGYIDPPTEFIDESTLATPIGSLGDGTQIWKITHNGVDTHPIHVHLFNVQLINRVGWDGAVKPPEPNELGWKETVRMNPLEDCIVALRAVAPKIPFGVPDSVRPLDPTMPIGSTAGFFGVDPNGNPITVTNQMTNFGWEYVWHCHILSHEEMDMMRPMVFNVARVLPITPVLSATGTPPPALPGSPVILNWTDGTPASSPATLGNPANEIGFRIERATGLAGTFATIGTVLANITTYTDTTTVLNTLYRYRVVAFNAAGDSPSAPVTVSPPGPAAPTNLQVPAFTSSLIYLSWRDNSNNETSFAVWRSTNGGPFAQIATVTRTAAQRTSVGGTVTYTNNGVAIGNTYAYYVTAVNASGPSAPSNTVTVSLKVPAAPSNLAGAAVRITGSTSNDSVTLTWTDNSNNETSFQIQRAGNSTFTSFVSTSTVGANVTSFTQNVSRTYDWYYRVRAINAFGNSPWSNVVFVTTP
jgi:FtsP/CotA-like multicopper oxidase with cupredoxin domain